MGLLKQASQLAENAAPWEVGAFSPHATRFQMSRASALEDSPSDFFRKLFSLCFS